MDGADAVLMHVDGQGKPHVLHHAHLPMPSDLRQSCLELNVPGNNELDRAHRAANGLALWYAELVDTLLTQSNRSASSICAIGVHGQTVRHQPNGAGDDTNSRYTVQLNNSALLAERTGIDVISHFRERDIAAGGQGAPLVPAFHRLCFSQSGQDTAVVNIGGIANVTWLGRDGSCLGWDSGPGNMLLDAWYARSVGGAWDDGGAWSLQGQCVSELLERWLGDPYFQQAGAKSSGREHFGEHWLHQTPHLSDYAPVDVQATLVELTAQSVVRSLPGLPQQILVCGGGALNQALMVRLQVLLPGTEVKPTSDVGMPVMQVEASAFAWLAWAWVHRTPGNWPDATGATGPRVLGALFPK